MLNWIIRSIRISTVCSITAEMTPTLTSFKDGHRLNQKRNRSLQSMLTFRSSRATSPRFWDCLLNQVRWHTYTHTHVINSPVNTAMTLYSVSPRASSGSPTPVIIILCRFFFFIHVNFVLQDVDETK